MKLKDNFLLRQVAGSWVVIPIGQETLDFDNVITLNETGLLLWKKLEAGADMEELTTAITREYNISLEEARADVKEFCDRLIRIGCLEP